MKSAKDIKTMRDMYELVLRDLRSVNNNHMLDGFERQITAQKQLLDWVLK